MNKQTGNNTESIENAVSNQFKIELKKVGKLEENTFGTAPYDFEDN